MHKTATKPPANDLYESDFYAWTQQQARAVEERRWGDVDALNVADEIGSLGQEVEREIADRTEILLSYLLKWRQLAEYRGLAWKENIDRQRSALAGLFAENPTLADGRDTFVAESYENAVRRLKYETYFLENDFPPSCPFTIGQVFDATYFPEEFDALTRGQFPTAS